VEHVLEAISLRSALALDDEIFAPSAPEQDLRIAGVKGFEWIVFRYRHEMMLLEGYTDSEDASSAPIDSATNVHIIGVDGGRCEV